MLSEREMLVNPITGGKTARLYELRSGSTELRDYLLGCIGTSDAAEEEMKTLTDPKLGRRLTVPVKWDELAVLAVGGKACCCREVSTRRSSRPSPRNTPTGASNRTTATGPGGRSSTRSPSG